MSRIEPLTREDLPEFADYFAQRDATNELVGNPMLTMARRPNILNGFLGLLQAVYHEGEVSASLKRLIAFMRSSAAGCQFCQAHASNSASKHGIETEKIEAVWEFEDSPLFSDAERAALRLARDAAQLPNLATDEHFEDLRKYYDEGQIVEIVAVISLFAYLNNWNDTVASTLEAGPLAFAEEHLVSHGWSVGKHA